MVKGITFIGECQASVNHAGNKARADVDVILREKYGFPYETLGETIFTGFLDRIKYLLKFSALQQIRRIRQLHSQKVIMQYPFYFKTSLKKALRDSLKKNEVIIFVHDVDSLRDIKGADIRTEIGELNLAKAVIVHNNTMGSALQNLGLKVPWFSLGLFDYLLPCIPERSFSKGTTVVFAGNLGKSEFLCNAEIETLGLHFNLYGPNFCKESIKWENVSYKGSFPPDEVPLKLEGSFGLVWDGTDVRTCDGPTGTYMKYNNPHKLSLYIAAGLPVVVWRQAAIADFVETNNIGITIESLTDISKRIQTLSVSEYNEMAMAVKKLQKQVVSGSFTRRCLKIVEGQILDTV